MICDGSHVPLGFEANALTLSVLTSFLQIHVPEAPLSSLIIAVRVHKHPGHTGGDPDGVAERSLGISERAAMNDAPLAAASPLCSSTISTEASLQHGHLPSPGL